MRVKAALPFVTAAVLALSLTAACSSGPQSANQSGSSAGSGSTTLTWTGWADDQTADALITQFEKDNPGVTVKHTGLPWPGILTQINTELVSGTAADVVVVFPGNGNPITTQTLAKGSYLTDLSSSEWASKYTDSGKAVISADGKVLMAADGSTIIPAIYNKQALADVGATAPKTFTEVMNLCSAAKSKGKVAYAFAGLAGGNYLHYIYALTATQVYGPNPNFAQDQADGKATFANSAWTSSMDQLIKMRDAGCFSKNPLGTSIEVAQKQVATGDAVGIVTVSPQVSAITEQAKSGTEFETAAFPATDNPADTVLPVGLGAGIGVNAKAKNPELAKKLVDFYMSEAGLNIAVKVGNTFPSIPLNGYKPSSVMAGVADQAQTGKTVAFPDQLWPNANLNQVFNDELQKVLGDKTTVAQALAAMDSAYTS